LIKQATSNPTENRIPILDSYYMTADANQYILVKEIIRQSRKSDDTYKDSTILGYYGTIRALCDKVLKDSIRDGIQSGALRSLREIVSEMDALTTRLEAAVTL
jgi:hypothetical protein